MGPCVSLYTSRGCPATCTFCLWPPTHSGRCWRLRSTNDAAAEVRYALGAFPEIREIFFDDDTINYRKARTLELKEAGCRLLIVGYESGDPQILKNIKEGATIERALKFTENCKKLGLVIHGNFIVGLPGETKEALRRTIDFANRLDWMKRNLWMQSNASMRNYFRAACSLACGSEGDIPLR